MKFVFIGLTITSSWGNGHATTYRSLIRALHDAGHMVHFLELDVPVFAENRDLTSCDFCKVGLYNDLANLKHVFGYIIQQADVVILGSLTSQASEIADWLFAQSLTCPVLFYDLDTPATLTALEQGSCEYLKVEAIPLFDAYLSFSGGRALEVLADCYGCVHPEVFYCSADPKRYRPDELEPRWAMGYLGSYSADRQPSVDSLLLNVARKAPDQNFVLAGPQFPPMEWPTNCERIEHLPPHEHSVFYNLQRFTLNLTRADMRSYGWSPSVRLFEAAVCGVPIISDWWEGLDELLVPGHEILIAQSTDEALHYLNNVSDYSARLIGLRARDRILRHHTPVHRAAQLERLVAQLKGEPESVPLLHDAPHDRVGGMQVARIVAV